ncbi:MAG: peptidylprolyl isomerase [Cyclobacteriaceae bacterium]
MKSLLFVLANLLFLTACGDKNKDYLVTIKTSYGDMKVLLYEETPLHKQNFLELARSGRFDSTIFHRVINEFMIQGGNVYEKEGKQEPKETRVPAEIVDGLFHKKGELAAARQGDRVNPERMSSSSQFYIVHGKVYSEAELTVDQIKLNQSIQAMLQKEEYKELYDQFVALQRAGEGQKMSELALEYKEECERVMGVELDKEFDRARLEAYTTVGGTPHLDDQYTVFGRVVEGFDVIDKIAVVETAAGDRPVQPIHMTMEVEAVKKKKITKDYGYVYPGSK